LKFITSKNLIKNKNILNTVIPVFAINDGAGITKIAVTIQIINQWIHK
jgi:hypothetical protein